jgi:hypothetical protein
MSRLAIFSPETASRTDLSHPEGVRDIRDRCTAVDIAFSLQTD